SLEGGDAVDPGQFPKAEMVWATPGYLETMGIPLVRGRDLRWTDVQSAPHVVLINEAFVRRLIPSGDPLGRRITNLLGPGNDPWEIAGVTLAMAALGIYGLLAYSVAQRSREIGIRMALGADSWVVLRLVVRSGLRLALAGLALGVAGALIGTRVLASLVYQVGTTDPATLAATAAILTASALLASWIPARRAARVD